MRFTRIRGLSAAFLLTGSNPIISEESAKCFVRCIFLHLRYVALSMSSCLSDFFKMVLWGQNPLDSSGYHHRFFICSRIVKAQRGHLKREEDNLEEIPLVSIDVFQIRSTSSPSLQVTRMASTRCRYSLLASQYSTVPKKTSIGLSASGALRCAL